MLSISGASYVASLIALFGGSSFTSFFVLIFGGLVLFGVGGKIAHYRFRDATIKGNSNAWFPGWRHSFLADSFAVLGVLLVIISIIRFYACSSQL